MLDLNKDRRLARLHLAILAAASALLLARCFFSFCWSDESYYLTLVHSYWQGARPFVDVWRQEQFYAVLLLPFYSLYRAVVGSTTGIYLATRLLCKSILVVLSFCTYQSLKKKGRWPALAASVLILFYSRANIGGFSYYDCSFYFFLAAALLLYQWQAGQKREFWRGVLMGVLLAMSVLCAPFLAFGWVILLPPLFVKRYRRYRKIAWGILVGTALAAVVYLGWVLSRATPAELIANIPHLFEDPEANPRGLVTITDYFEELWEHFFPAGPAWIALIGYGLLQKLRVRLGRRKQPVPGSAETMILFWAAFVAFVVSWAVSWDKDGNGQAALWFFALICWLMTPAQNRDRRTELCFFWAGLGFSLVWQFTSNTGFDAMTIGFAVGTLGSCQVLANFVRAVGASKMRRAALWTLNLTLALVLLMQTAQMLFRVYRDGPLPWCTALTDRGPAKGIFTMPEHKEQYDLIYDTLTGPEFRREGAVFITKQLPWAYLCTDRICGAPGGWSTSLNNEQLKEYYRTFPDKLPTTVFVLDPDVGWSISTQTMVRKEDVNKNSDGSFMENEMERRGYTMTKEPCGRLYSAPL